MCRCRASPASPQEAGASRVQAGGAPREAIRPGSQVRTSDLRLEGAFPPPGQPPGAEEEEVYESAVVAAVDAVDEEEDEVDHAATEAAQEEEEGTSASSPRLRG